jgi:chemotaxis protein methyltransferase WspC
MNLEPVLALLRRQIGLDPESLGRAVLPRAVAARMQALGVPTPESYAARLARDAGELQHLLSDAAVPETWFFRGGEVFRYLARHVAEVVRLESVRKRYRILCVPCSSGEEPYSLAIALLEAGVDPAAWSIDAVDLSARHLERARAGRYSEFSFRQTAPELRQQWFRAREGGWELASRIRSLVTFRQGNLLDPHFLGGEAPFDLIFCRNLLIYFHAEARRRALDVLDRLLAPDGWLSMGYAEPLEFQDPRFARIGPTEFFLYTRSTMKPVFPQVEDLGALAPATAQPASILTTPLLAAPDTPPTVDDSVRRARQLADRGQLDEALDLCQALLQQLEPSAELFHLMGVIHQARNQPDEAVRCYERALYLEPTHSDALTHLMLQCRERGDHAQAQRLQRRLERISVGGEA